MSKPHLYTCLSPALLHLYDVRDCIVVVIDVLRATSTIATALHNGAREIIPVDSVERCIQLGKELECVTAGERDGQVAEGLQYGNSSFEYPPRIYFRKNPGAHHHQWNEAPAYGAF